MIAQVFIHPDLEVRQKAIEDYLTKVGVAKNSPDLLLFTDSEKLGVEEAKAIRTHYSLKPISDKFRIVVLESSHTLTIPAQNALLKTIEELSDTSILVMGAQNQNVLIPTVLSRLQIEVIDQNYNPEIDRDKIRKVLNSPIELRFKFIEGLEDKNAFLDDLVVFFEEYLQKNPQSFKYSALLLEAKAWQGQNVNIRAILEYLMLELPRLD